MITDSERGDHHGRILTTGTWLIFAAALSTGKRFLKRTIAIQIMEANRALLTPRRKITLLFNTYPTPYNYSLLLFIPRFSFTLVIVGFSFRRFFGKNICIGFVGCLGFC